MFEGGGGVNSSILFDVLILFNVIIRAELFNCCLRFHAVFHSMLYLFRGFSQYGVEFRNNRIKMRFDRWLCENVYRGLWQFRKQFPNGSRSIMHVCDCALSSNAYQIELIERTILFSLQKQVIVKILYYEKRVS